MSEKAYLDADYEVISMVNRARNDRLPRKTLTFIPTDRAEHVEAIDNRIQQIREHMPQIATGAVILSFLIGLAL